MGPRTGLGAVEYRGVSYPPEFVENCQKLKGMPITSRIISLSDFVSISQLVQALKRMQIHTEIALPFHKPIFSFKKNDFLLRRKINYVICVSALTLCYLQSDVGNITNLKHFAIEFMPTERCCTVICELRKYFILLQNLRCTNNANERGNGPSEIPT